MSSRAASTAEHRTLSLLCSIHIFPSPPDLSITALNHHHLHQTYVSFTTLLMQDCITVPWPLLNHAAYSPALNALKLHKRLQCQNWASSSLAWLWPCGSSMPLLHAQGYANGQPEPQVCLRSPYPDLAPCCGRGSKQALHATVMNKLAVNIRTASTVANSISQSKEKKTTQFYTWSTMNIRSLFPCQRPYSPFTTVSPPGSNSRMLASAL
jgi:hypothetical protein